VSTQKGGWLQSQKVQRAIKALTRDLNDYDVGCLVCDFGAWYTRMKRHLHNDIAIWLDRATIQFRVLRPNSGYTGRFCVFGPVLSSAAHAAASLDMPPIGIEIAFVL
jgi:hypothetical protein